MYNNVLNSWLKSLSKGGKLVTEKSVKKKSKNEILKVKIQPTNLYLSIFQMAKTTEHVKCAALRTGPTLLKMTIRSFSQSHLHNFLMTPGVAIIQQL